MAKVWMKSVVCRLLKELKRTFEKRHLIPYFARINNKNK